MAAAMAYCTSSTAFYQHAMAKPRSQFTPLSRRTNLSQSSPPLCSTPTSSHTEQSCTVQITENDENNNNTHPMEHIDVANNDEILIITSDDEDGYVNADGVDDTDADEDTTDICDENNRMDPVDEEQFLACVGLRRKAKKPMVPNLHLRSLTKRLAFPVCLLPLPKYSERVRQALYLRLPSLKFLTITCDIEKFCSTDANIILPRAITPTRSLSILNSNYRKGKLSKAELINMTYKTSRYNRRKTSISKYVHSILQCHVVLDRLEHSAINQLMEKSTKDGTRVSEISTPEHQKHIKTSRPVSASKTVAAKVTMSAGQNKTKRKAPMITTDETPSKRIKTFNSTCTIMSNDSKTADSNSILYQRIYLKCFVCSKREYVDARKTNSDVLHSHWLEHERGLSMNIYDSEIDSILTRVVEFHNSPKQHMLEGNIKTVFILDSKEIRYSSTSNSIPNDECIVID